MSPKPLPKGELQYLRWVLTLTETPQARRRAAGAPPASLAETITALENEPEAPWQSDATGTP